MVSCSSDLQIVQTADGSDTLFHRDLNQHYHSTFGAMRESQHIFIETGLLNTIEKINACAGSMDRHLSILEIGFGTGLNALMTLAEAEKNGIRIHYTTIEAYPLEEKYWKTLNYPQLFGSTDYSEVFSNLHLATWNIPVMITPYFTLHKIHSKLEHYSPARETFNLIYFDAFGTDAQPELWTSHLLCQLCTGLIPGGVFVTYSVKGVVVRALQSAGLQTEKLPGPPGKRHILRAVKIK